MKATSTDGQRIYAIGDVHGRSDLLTVILARVEDDLAMRPHPHPRLVLLGDYVDRGPDSRGVIERLIRIAESGTMPVSFLLGNHDTCLLAYLDDPEWSDSGLHWFHTRMGGAATLASYGVLDVSDLAPSHGHGAFLEAFPEKHRHFLEQCAFREQIGSYLFVHAGVRPGVAIEDQAREDLLWIREPFLSSRHDFGVKIVHGHTIVPFVEHRPNRIALDTGAVRSGVLSCIVLEDDDVALLTSAGPRPLPLGSGLGFDRLQRSLISHLEKVWPGRSSIRAQAFG